MAKWVGLSEGSHLPGTNRHQAEAVVLLSGGLDSTACLAYLRSRGHPTRALFVDYGQRAAAPEARAAADIAHHYGTPLQNIHVTGLVDNASGFVAGRNAYLIRTAALNYSGKPLLLAIGIHQGTNYPDCSPEFAERMDNELRLESGGLVRLSAPFVEWTKRDIWDYAHRENLPLSKTYSCQEGSDPPCQRCQSCRDVEALLVRA